MRVIEVTQFAHSVSFTVEDDQGSLCFVEYRRDQVWQDEQGIWQIGEDQQPQHLAPLPKKARLPKISMQLADAISSSAAAVV
jgi:hypothetical protein